MAAMPQFDLSLRLGLGCSRLGSVMGATGSEAKRLLATALEEGVRFFDTSSIYAQGDSERLLGAVLGQRKDCIICTKVGQHLPLQMQALAPFKGLVRMAVSQSAGVRQILAQARDKPVPTNWDVSFLTQGIESSLRRLNRDHIEIMMLHGAPAEVLSARKAVGALEAARRAGKIGIVGVSVDDVAAAMEALDDDRVGALQIPLLPGDDRFDRVLDRASERGVAIVAREILGGKRAISGAVDPTGFAASRIAELITQNDIAVVLAGTTTRSHLREAASAARQAVPAV